MYFLISYIRKTLYSKDKILKIKFISFDYTAKKEKRNKKQINQKSLLLLRIIVTEILH